jgi:RimJ/RimL family protein N-acetyltransferase
VRPLATGEAAAVRQVFDAMSAHSRYERFLVAKPKLSPTDIGRLTAVDHQDHEAFVAFDPKTGRVVGEAHLVRDKNRRCLGEIAFAVADAWQNRRLGTVLADALARRARELGITRVRGNMHAGNSRSAALVRRMGRVVTRTYEAGALELEIALGS